MNKKYRTSGGVAVPAGIAPYNNNDNNNNGRAVLIEDDQDEYNNRSNNNHDNSNNIMESRIIHRPIARRPIPTRPQQQTTTTTTTTGCTLVRPVPVRVGGGASGVPVPESIDVQNFYKETHDANIPMNIVHQGIQESHEWLEKYTTGPPVVKGKESPVPTATTSSPTLPSSGSPDDDNNDDDEESVIMNPMDFIMDREAGARNPSPGAACASSFDNNKSNSIQISRPVLQRPVPQRIIQQHHKRGRTSSPQEQEQQDPQEQPQQQPVLIRPVAIRAKAPIVLPRHLPSSVGGNNDNDDRPMSPLSLYSSASQQQYHNQQHQQTQLRSNAVVIEDETGSLPGMQMSTTQASVASIASAVEKARDDILHAVAISGGEASSEKFANALETLQSCNPVSTNHSTQSEGTWLTLTKPTFFDCLGENDSGDPMYTLGRMSFDMFTPSNLVCSLQGNFNQVDHITSLDSSKVPKKLHDEVCMTDSNTVLRTYHIITAFTIEPHLAAFPDAPNRDVVRPIRGIMTTYGYMIADPEERTRNSVWITGGRIEPNNNAQDVLDWIRLFNLHPPKHVGMGVKAKLLAVKLLMGAVLPDGMNQTSGVMEYTFTRPLGGHGLAYIDTLYIDSTLRIVRGHRGTLFVFTKINTTENNNKKSTMSASNNTNDVSSISTSEE